MTLKVVTERSIIRNMRKIWMDRYSSMKPTSRFGFKRTVGEIRFDLKKLDLETCSMEEVEEIIEGTLSLRNRCDHCDKDVKALIRFGDEPDYQSRWQDLCLECLEEGARVLREI